VLNNPPPLRAGVDSDPFLHGTLGRRLRLVVDDESVGQSLAVQVLEQLGHRPSARVHWTRRPAPGRVTLGSPVPQRDFIPALIEDGDDAIETAIPAASRIRERSEALAREHGVDVSQAERLLRLATLSRTGRLVDATVVGETVLLSPPFDRQLLPHCLTPREAVALLGLNLRAHGDFAVSRGDSTTRLIGAARFYRAVAFQQVVGLDTWIGAAVTRWLQERHRPLTLVDGVATRIGRAFRARDFLQVRLRAPDYEIVWDEVLFFFDVVLVQAMGALDLLARLLHDIYALEGSARRPSWRSRRGDGWVSELERAAPEIAAVAGPGQPLGDIVDLVAELRNVIHDAPLSEEIHDPDGAPGIDVWGPGLIALEPSDPVDIMLAAAERRDGLVSWGVSDRRPDGAVVLDPGLFAEQALRACTAALSDVLALADHHRLSGALAADISMWVPTQGDRENAAVLFGLARGGLRQDRVTFA